MDYYENIHHVGGKPLRMSCNNTWGILKNLEYQPKPISNNEESEEENKEERDR